MAIPFTRPVCYKLYTVYTAMATGECFTWTTPGLVVENYPGTWHTK
ncbi:hypothetical protein [Niastella koreensis]|nr:hypothetical protein [Niastella koreensis]